MKKFLALTILLLPAISYGQVVTVDGKYPQLPSALGANGGLKVECLSGCSGSGGATGGLTDAELRALPVVVTETTIGGVRYPFGSISFSENWLLGVAGKNISDSTYWPIPLSDGGLKIPVSISSLPLPTGAATDSSLTLIATSNQEIADAYGTPGFAVNAQVVQLGASDGTNNQRLRTTTGTPAGTEQGLIVRNIPSGTQPVSGTFWQATQPISGTVTANISGSISNTTFTATQATGTNLHVVVDAIPTTAVTGTFWQATQPVSGPLTDTQLRATPVPISGTVTANAGTGTMAVSGPLTDTQLRATAVPISGFIQEGTSTRWSCFIQAATVTTQCRAAPAAGLILYVTSVSMSNQAATVQTLDIVYGTGAACVTGTTALTHKYQFGTNGTTTSPFVVSVTFDTPLVPAAANAICVRPSAATAFGVTITGYTGS